MNRNRAINDSKTINTTVIVIVYTIVMKTIVIHLRNKFSNNMFYRSHYHDQNRLNKETKEDVRNELALQELDKVENYPVKFKYTFKFTSRKLDVINCSCMIKCIEDGLIDAGIIIDDAPSFINGIEIEINDEKQDVLWKEEMLKKRVYVEVKVEIIDIKK